MAEDYLAAEDIKALNRRFIEEVLNKGNLDVVDELIAEDVIDHNPWPGQSPGSAGVKEQMAMLRNAFPDLRLDIEVEIAEGDLLATVETFTGTHEDMFMGIPASGTKVSVTGIDVVRVSNGKFTEHWGLFDTAAMMEQLGMMPTVDEG